MLVAPYPVRELAGSLDVVAIGVGVDLSGDELREALGAAFGSSCEVLQDAPKANIASTMEVESQARIG
ncbi:hypothetical protein ASC61_12540 [Aeromicrobium sp. Root344]|nr:hypothetical protein ASC61_12540 [Aeromicrobium sp. Root344]